MDAMATRALGAEGWSDSGPAPIARGLAAYAATATIGLAALVMGAILLGLIATRALIFSPQKLAFDIKRINPVKNAAQKFGKDGLVTFAFSLGKAGLVCAGGWFLFASLLDRIAAAAMADGQWVAALGSILGQVLMLGLVVSIVFTVPDMLWKWFDHRRKNRMSRQEMQDEFKDSEGDPHMKGARRQRAVDIAMKQMLADVPTADVIIVNPTHYAVALKWSRGSGRAPVCVAKGTDEVAARIRAKATEAGVPIWSDPPCARAIHAQVKVGEEIDRAISPPSPPRSALPRRCDRRPVPDGRQDQAAAAAGTHRAAEGRASAQDLCGVQCAHDRRTPAHRFAAGHAGAKL